MHSLLESKTPAILWAEIVLKSSGFKGLFLALEGEDDIRFWRSRVDPSSLRLLQCGGKSILMGLLDIVEARNHTRTLALADADFERALNTLRVSTSLAYTDLCDLDSTLVFSKALDKIISEYGDHIKLAAFEAAQGISFVRHLIKISLAFGRLRFVNFSQGWGVDFDKLSPYKYVDHSTWALDESRLNADVLQLSNCSQLEFDSAILECLEVLNGDPLSLVQGHDCMRVLAIGLGPKALGITGGKAFAEGEARKAFRLAFDRSIMRQTSMWRDLNSLAISKGQNIFSELE